MTVLMKLDKGNCVYILKLCHGIVYFYLKKGTQKKNCQIFLDQLES